MGWKLTGIAINKDFTNDIKSLFNLLAIKNFSFKAESTFEEATSQIYEEELLSIGFFKNGSFLSTGIELIVNDAILAKASFDNLIIAFYVNEVMSTYCFDIYKEGKHIRKNWVSFADKNIDSTDNFGELLEEEKSEDDPLEVILNIISSVIGEEFYQIEEDKPMLLYQLRIEENVAEIKKGKGFWKRLFG